MMIPVPDIDFTPWLVPSEPDGDAVVSDDAPDDIKDAWRRHMAQLDRMYAATEISD